MTEVDRVGERIEQLLGEFSGADAELAEELVRTLLEFYGAGLARIVELVDPAPARPPRRGRPRPRPARAARPAPPSTHERVTEALDKVRPYLGSHAGDVEFVGIDDGVAASCGCRAPATAARPRRSPRSTPIERVVREAAPEISDVVVEGVVPEETGPGGRALLPLVPCPVEVP